LGSLGGVGWLGLPGVSNQLNQCLHSHSFFVLSERGWSQTKAEHERENPDRSGGEMHDEGGCEQGRTRAKMETLPKARLYLARFHPRFQANFRRQQCPCFLWRFEIPLLQPPPSPINAKLSLELVTLGDRNASQRSCSLYRERQFLLQGSFASVRCNFLIRSHVQTIDEASKRLTSLWVLQFLDGFAFDLTNAFAGHLENLANFF